MKRPLVECIPNFSEGRRVEVVEAIVKAMQQAAPIHVLDTSSDADHNRTVITFVGEPEAVERAAFAGIKMAAQQIDMTQHTGEHPRLGASDVVPFVPIRNVTMDECIAMAKRLGQRVGEDLNIPVYLYESAATRPDRENLANLRSSKFQYEQLSDAIRTEPDRMPDFGPAELGTAGASVIGARPPLVAYNVYLNTDNVDIASKIAKAIRHSNGGLRFVKSNGFLVEGQAQVSINLTNYQKTPVYRVVEMIRREADRYGARVTHSELVGLAPQEFFIEAARWYLQLDKFEIDQVLEYRIQSAEAEVSPLAEEEPPVPEGATRQVPAVGAPSITPGAFVHAVSEATSTPGGGAVAALAGSLSAALAEMVARLTVSKKSYAETHETMNAIVAAAGDLRQRLLSAIDEDITAFNMVMDAYRLSKEDPNRGAAIQSGMIRASDAPLSVARMALEAMQLSEKVARQGNKNAVSDAAVAALMGMAAVEGAALNVRVNAVNLEDADQRVRYQEDVKTLVERARVIREAVIAAAEERAGLAR